MKYDLVIIGGGVAGLSAAIRAHELKLRVLVIDGSGPGFTQAATHLAQGGLAVTGLPDAPAGTDDEPDSVDLHTADTIAAGCFHNDIAHTRDLIGAAAEAVTWLISHGAQFDVADTATGVYHRALEGGHSRHRIVHAADHTGAEIESALIFAAERAGIPVLTAYAQAITPSGVLTTEGEVDAESVLIATGGVGQLYSSTTAPAGARGTGIALAVDAGADVSDMEFIQFHPTVLYLPGVTGQKPLLTEALRGAGARIVHADGSDAVTDNLAPRDVVAREIAPLDQVFLDARAIPGVDTLFPGVAHSVAIHGFDLTSDLIPIAPAAHYTCGGITTDAHGRTSVPGLYAAGECARTGLHGANRLASNSLMEGVVVGRRVAEDVARHHAMTTNQGEHVFASRKAGLVRPQLTATQLRALQAEMTTHAGLLRSHENLAAARAFLNTLPPAPETLVAGLIVDAATARKETLGCHTMGIVPPPKPAAVAHFV